MNRREREEYVKQEYIKYKEVVQERPYTYVVLDIDAPGAPEFEEFGFSKVMHPDAWDAKRGINIARDRAIRKATRKIEKYYVFDE